MYLIKIDGLGFVHSAWDDQEPRFCATLSAARAWPTLTEALRFGNNHLTSRLPIGWELWEETADDLVPLMRPQQR